MDVCCAAGEPVRYDYEPKGSVVSLGEGGLEGYLTAGERALCRHAARPLTDAACAAAACVPPAPCAQPKVTSRRRALAFAGTKPAAIVVIYDIFGYAEFPQVGRTAVQWRRCAPA